MVIPLPFDVHLSSAAEKIEKKLTNNPNILPQHKRRKSHPLSMIFTADEAYDPNNFPIKILKTIIH